MSTQLYIREAANAGALAFFEQMNSTIGSTFIDVGKSYCPETLFARAVKSTDPSEKVFAYLGIMLLSLYINAMCVMAELIVVNHGNVSKTFAQALELCTHIFIGPVSAIAFITRDSFSTVLFFVCLWTFFNDSNIFRPSNMVATKVLFNTPNPNVRTVHRLHWALSFMTFFHHFVLSTAKLALNEEVLTMPGTLPVAGIAILFWLIGSGVIHLSVAMGDAGMSTAIPLRITGIVCRVGGDFAMLLECYNHSQFVEWSVLGGLDIAWWAGQITLLIKLKAAKNRCSPAELKEAMTRSEEETKEVTKSLRMSVKESRKERETAASMRVGSQRPNDSVTGGE